MLSVTQKQEIRSTAEALLSDLVAISSPYFHEDAIIAYLEERLKTRFRTEIQNYEESQLLEAPFSGKNLIADYGNFDKGFIVLNGHVDTVIQTTDWEWDPLRLKREGDQCYGLGALDMKGGVTGFIVAMEFMKQNGLLPSVGVRLNAVSDEEGPNSLGTLHSWRAGYYEGCRGVVIGESVPPFSNQPVGFPSIGIGGRGRYLHKVTFKGVPGHGAQPEKGINALKDAARLSVAIDNLPLHEHPLLGKETVCVLKIEGGWLTLTIPDKATVYFDRHVVAGTTSDQVEKELAALIRSLGLQSDVTFSFKETLPDGVVYLPYLAQSDHPFITTLCASCERITGKATALTGMVSICDMNVLGPRIEAPVVVFGPTGENVHRSREWVSLSSVCEMAETLVSFFMEYVPL